MPVPIAALDEHKGKKPTSADQSSLDKLESELAAISLDATQTSKPRDSGQAAEGEQPQTTVKADDPKTTDTTATAAVADPDEKSTPSPQHSGSSAEAPSTRPAPSTSAKTLVKPDPFQNNDLTGDAFLESVLVDYDPDDKKRMCILRALDHYRTDQAKEEPMRVRLLRHLALKKTPFTRFFGAAKYAQVKHDLLVSADLDPIYKEILYVASDCWACPVIFISHKGAGHCATFLPIAQPAPKTPEFSHPELNPLEPGKVIVIVDTNEPGE